MKRSALDSKRRSMRRRSWTRVAIGIITVAAIAALVWLIWFSSVLAVQKVDVVGESTLTDSQVRAVAKVRLGQPLARLDDIAIESRVASMERVSDVNVKRKWPQTVRIEITERVAVAWIVTSDGVRGVDRQGVDFRDYAKPPQELVQITSLPTIPERRQHALEAASSVVFEIRRLDRSLYEQVQKVVAPTRDSVQLELTKGRIVIWGSAESAQAKVTVLKPLLAIAARRFDVSAPEQPTTRK